MAREAIAAAAIAADFPRRGSGVAIPEARLEEEEEEEEEEAEANDEWRDSDSDPCPDPGGQERERRRACCCCCARHVDSMLWEVVGSKDCFGW